MNSTESFYEKVMGECRLIFGKKMSDYGAAWRILRLSSLTDQIFIKAQRIRSIQELKNLWIHYSLNSTEIKKK